MEWYLLSLKKQKGAGSFGSISLMKDFGLLSYKKLKGFNDDG